jgi:hypothetical protein
MATPIPACPHESTNFRSSAEDMLREMAFVLHVTQSLKQAIIADRTSAGTVPA